MGINDPNAGAAVSHRETKRLELIDDQQRGRQQVDTHAKLLGLATRFLALLRIAASSSCACVLVCARPSGTVFFPTSPDTTLLGFLRRQRCRPRGVDWPHTAPRCTRESSCGETRAQADTRRPCPRPVDTQSVCRQTRLLSLRFGNVIRVHSVLRGLPLEASGCRVPYASEQGGTRA